MMNYAELRRLRGEHLRRMAEPDDLCALRQQAERIRADRALAARGIIADAPGATVCAARSRALGKFHAGDPDHG